MKQTKELEVKVRINFQREKKCKFIDSFYTVIKLFTF